jgi:hypothetical protein
LNSNVRPEVLWPDPDQLQLVKFHSQIPKKIWNFFACMYVCMYVCTEHTIEIWELEGEYTNKNRLFSL